MQITLADAFARAAAAERRGDRPGARAIYEAVLAAVPEHPGALLGVARHLRAERRRAEARELLQRAAASADSKSLPAPEIWVELGRVEDDERNFAAARTAYANALAESPRHVPALLGAGDVALMTGDFGVAEAHFRAALAEGDTRVAPWTGLAQALAGTRRFADAEAALQRALALAPADRGALAAAAWVALQTKDWDGAKAHCRAGLAAAPGDATLLRLLGEALKASGEPDAAREAFAAAAAGNPDDMSARIGLGGALLDLGRASEAKACLEAAIADGATDAEAFANLGLACLAHEDYERAAAMFERAVDANPGLTPALANLVTAKRYLGDWNDLAALESRLVATLDDPRADPRLSPFVALSLPISPAQQLHAATRWSRAMLPEPAAPATVRARGERLRIGYLSRDFRDHATGRLIVGLIEAHDRRAVEVFGFGYGAASDSPLRRRICAAFDRWHDLTFAGDRALAQAIREAGIDVLIESNGHTRGGRLAALAERPASVQLHYLAYPGTLGYDAIDGIIADEIVVPPTDDAFHHERVFRLPRCYLVTDHTRERPQPARRADHGLPDDGVVLACLNQTYKLGPDFFAIWMEALATAPDSVLWLFGDHPRVQGNLRAEAERHGVAAQRLVFAPRVAQEAHIARLACADLALDTLPVGSHTTGADALWAGVPLLTCRGERFAGRVGASLLAAAGMPDLVTSDLAGYRERLLELVVRPAALREFSAHLADTRDASPLWDTASFAADFEALVLRAYDEVSSARA